jgi:nucleoside-diphosphate-sugar epimerase
MKSQTSGAFNVSSGIGLKVRDILSVIQGNSTLNIVQLPADWTAGTKRLGSSSKITSELGWRTRTSIEAGIRATKKALQ